MSRLNIIFLAIFILFINNTFAELRVNFALPAGYTANKIVINDLRPARVNVTGGAFNCKSSTCGGNSANLNGFTTIAKHNFNVIEMIGFEILFDIINQVFTVR